MWHKVSLILRTEFCFGATRTGLMAANGRYANLFTLQARGYR